MEHTYILIAEGIAFRVMLVTNDAVGGRYQILSLAYCGIKGSSYNSPEEVEELFDSWVKHGVIDAWYPMWHAGMKEKDAEAYHLKVKHIMNQGIR